VCDLREISEEEARELTWARIGEHIAAAVRHELPVYGDHTPGGSTADSQAWRQASPEDLAERIAVFAMAAIGPVLTEETVANGVAMMRTALARAGIDPATLSWSGPGTAVVTGSRPASREGGPGNGQHS
jgi:hypothetical protein